MMHKYEMVIRWSEDDDLYVAMAPELGCVSYGATSEAALQALNKLIPFWLESLSQGGRPIPQSEKIPAPPISKSAASSQSQRVVTTGFPKNRSRRKNGR